MKSSILADIAWHLRNQKTVNICENLNEDLLAQCFEAQCMLPSLSSLCAQFAWHASDKSSEVLFLRHSSSMRRPDIEKVEGGTVH